MVGTIKGITIELDGKTTKLTAALKEVNTPAQNLQSNLKKVNSALKLDPTNTELLAEKQKILASYVDVTKEKLQKLEDVQDQIKQQYANGEIDQGAYLDFQRELEQTNAKLKDLEDQQKQFGSVVQQQMEIAGQKVSEFGDKISSAGTALSKGVTTPIVAVGTASMAAFSNVDDGLDTIVKATGATGDALGSLEDSYKKIASEMPVDFDVAAAAVGEVNTRFHTTGEELERQSQLLIKFSEITGSDVVQATDDADKALKAYGESADSLQGFLGLVASKSQETGISAQALMQDVTKNAASFKELGFTLEESIGLLAQMDANGVDTSTALSGLKKAVTNLTDSGMAQDAALRTVIDSIKNATSETEALQIAQETFGTKGAAEMATAIREGRLDIDALSESMADCSSVVDDTFASTVGDASDEAKTALNALTVAGAELGGTISEMLAPIIMDVAGLIRDLTAKWNGLDDGQKQSIVRIAAIVAAIGPVLAIGGKLISGIGSVIGVVGKLGTVLSFLAANPVALIIAAVAGIVAILVTAYNKCEWFRDGVNAAIGKVKEIWNSAVDGVKGIMDGLGQTWDKVTSGIKNAASTAMTAARDTVKEKLSNIKSAYEENGGGMKGVVAASMEAVKGYYSAGWTFVDKITGGKLTDIKNAIGEKMDGAKEAVSKAIDKIKGIFNFEWKWPKLKMPHFTVTGEFSLKPPISVPKLGVEWYAKGAILNGAQLFGALGGNLLGGGEAGPEAVLPLSGFYDNLRSILTQLLGSLQSANVIKVDINIDRFENRSDQDLNDLTDYIEDRIATKFARKEAAIG